MPLPRTRLVLSSALAAAFTLWAGPAAAYRTLADVEGTADPIAWEATPRVALDEASFAAPLRQTVAVELEHAAEVWNHVACGGPLLAVDLLAVDLLVVDHRAAVPEVRVRFEPAWAEAGFDADAAATTDVVLQSAPEGGTRLVSATIHLNGTMSWKPHGEARRRSERDVRVVLVHELGHVLGLAHNCEPSQPALECSDAHRGIVMHPIYGEGGGISLAADDQDGICALYAERAPLPAECTQTAECFEGEVCLDGACQADSSFGAACAVRSDCLTTYCIADSSSPAGGICTRQCEASAECPSGTACIPVEGQSLHVCGPIGSAASCSVSLGRGSSSAPFALFLTLAGLCVFRRLGCRP
ncbi:MAG: matrixin family metalloprotease [Sandaracinaceae bacterium]